MPALGKVTSLHLVGEVDLDQACEVSGTGYMAFHALRQLLQAPIKLLSAEERPKLTHCR